VTPSRREFIRRPLTQRRIGGKKQKRIMAANFNQTDPV
jgi:hypothetical protein